MTNKKMTKKNWFEELKNVVSASEYENKEEALKFLDREIELLNKKSSKNSMTKTQKENVEVVKKIKAALGTFEKAVTITELQKTEELSEYSNQKLSALLKQMVTAGEVVRTEEKKRAYFSLVQCLVGRLEGFESPHYLRYLIFVPFLTWAV